MKPINKNMKPIKGGVSAQQEGNVVPLVRYQTHHLT